MAALHEIYKCSICGNIVQLVHAGVGQLVCCNQPMQLMEENTVDASTEKHVPVVEENGDTVTVTVGSVEHPMEEKHYIEWIQVVEPGGTRTVILKPGDKPQAVFKNLTGDFQVREYCNLHGLWIV